MENGGKEWFLINGRPDPELAAAIEADADRKRREEPGYAEELERLDRQKAQSLIKDETEAALVFLRDNYNTDAAKRIFSHRPLIGPLFVKFKSFFYYLVHDVLELTLQNQSVYNFFVSSACRDLKAKLDRQQERLDRLEAEIESLKK